MPHGRQSSRDFSIITPLTTLWVRGQSRSQLSTKKLANNVLSQSMSHSVNDPPVVAETLTGTGVKEDAPATVVATLNATDVDGDSLNSAAVP